MSELIREALRNSTWRSVNGFGPSGTRGSALARPIRKTQGGHHEETLTPAALYARVSSDRQDVDLSVSAQLRALKDYARSDGYSVARVRGRVRDSASLPAPHPPDCRRLPADNIAPQSGA